MARKWRVVRVNTSAAGFGSHRSRRSQPRSQPLGSARAGVSHVFPTGLFDGSCGCFGGRKCWPQFSSARTARSGQRNKTVSIYGLLSAEITAAHCKDPGPAVPRKIDRRVRTPSYTRSDARSRPDQKNLLKNSPPESVIPATDYSQGEPITTKRTAPPLQATTLRSAGVEGPVLSERPGFCFAPPRATEKSTSFMPRSRKAPDHLAAIVDRPEEDRRPLTRRGSERRSFASSA